MTRDTEDVVERLQELLVAINEPQPKPLPEDQTSRAAEAMAGREDQRRYGLWRDRINEAQRQLVALVPELLTERQSLSDRIDVLEAERKQHLERLRQYQSHLQIVPMLLGPKAWELWGGWVDKEWLPTMLYQHYSWGPKARPGDGEAIAEMLLNVRDELASSKCKPLDFDD